MTLAQLAAVREIVRTGTVTAAARNLHRTQPAVTKQIHLLEQELQCTLFQRRGQRLALTHEGQTVYEKSNEVFESLDALKENLGGERGEVAGSLRIGCGPVPAAHILPRMIHGFLKQFPRVNLSVIETESPTFGPLLLRGRIDVGLGMRTSASPKLVFEPLCEDAIVLVCSRRSPLASLDHVTAGDLEGVPLIRYVTNTFLRQIVDTHVQRRGPRPPLSLEMGSTESILALVQLNMGVALMPGLMVAALKPKGVAIRPFEPAIPLDFGFCRLKMRYPPALLRAFLAFSRSHWRRPAQAAP